MRIKLLLSLLMLFNFAYSKSRFGLSRTGLMERKYTGVIIAGRDKVIINAIISMSRQDILDNKECPILPGTKIKVLIFELYHNLKYKSPSKTRYFLLSTLQQKNLTIGDL